jgi:hypothetical protein
MSISKTNKAAIAKNKKTIFSIEARVLAMKALTYQSHAMIEENCLMIMSNYSAAFKGNGQLANANTDEIFANRSAILGVIDADGDVQENYMQAQINKSLLDYLAHRSNLNTSVLSLSQKMAQINAQLVAINQDIMAANQSIVDFNHQQIGLNAEMLGRTLDASQATIEGNAAIVAENSTLMDDLSLSVEKDQARRNELLETSAVNAASLMGNKDAINERRLSIMENREGILANTAKIDLM